VNAFGGWRSGSDQAIAAALYLVSRNRKAGEVLVKLTPGEMELVIAFVQRILSTG
jgi:hypothetical protein